LLDEGRLHHIAEAPAFALPIYVVRSADADPSLVEPAIEGLREIVTT
jgi:hypothetical protein